MKVGVFYNSISNPKKFSNKTALMDNFKAGVLASGDRVIEYFDSNLPSEPLDAGFVLGYTLENNFRRKIINRLAQLNTHSVFVDSNILHYARGEHEWHRYSMGSVYPNEGVYFFNDLDLSKWETFANWHGVELKPWRTQGQHILILCQRPNGWNMFGNNQMQWLDATITEIRKHSNRPIRVRMHPGDGSRFAQIDQINAKHRGLVQISTNPGIREDLQNCWCAVGYNSTPTTVAAIEGIPVFVQDPQHSWAADVAFADLAQIESPAMPDRSHWAHKIANIHWSNQEVATGHLWRAIRGYILSAQK